jgi:signal transduction histidine kinase/ActR/RegA family two-component response regulator
MTILDIRPPDEQDALLRRVAEVAQQPVALTSGWRHRTRDGTVRDVHLMSRPVPFGSRKARIVIVDDITERRRAEEGVRALEAQLRQSQKMEAVGQLAGGIAHDFNNLLTAIKGYAHVALYGLGGVKDTSAPEAAAAVASARDDLHEIVGAADRAASLTAQLLAFSRRQVLQPVTLDLNGRATAMEGMVRRLIGEHIEVRLDLRARPGHVRADPSQVEQVLLNLVLNARDAMPAGGRLTIGTVDPSPDAGSATVEGPALSAGRFVALTVRDTGVGMDESTLSRVFEPFFTTKEVGKGTGLGLSTVYGIVKQSGGDVRLESAPGQGTTVTVYLPAADGGAVDGVVEPVEDVASPAQERRGDGPGAAESPDRATVLVVEDEPSVRQLARAVLEREGYRVLSAGDGVEALVLLARGGTEVLHALLTDVVMPGMSGPQLAAEVARLHPGVSVVYMSGYADDAVRQHGVLAPGAAFLAKPFELRDLAARVREAVEKDREAVRAKR